MLKDYDWITVEKHLFGQPNSTYDFKANNPKEAGERLHKLQEMKEKLGRNVNMRAMNVLTEAEERVSHFAMTMYGHFKTWVALMVLYDPWCVYSVVSDSVAHGL